MFGFRFTPASGARLALAALAWMCLTPVEMCAAEPATATPGATFNAEEHRFLEELQRASFRFFEEQTHPRTGLVSDRSLASGGPQKGKASIASSGFALAGWTIAVERGWVTREAALTRARLMLRFLTDEAPRHRGFLYHFMEPDSGARAWECELSPIDTTLFLVGAIVAREYFADPEITALVNRFYARLEWPWFLNGGDTLASSWRDETGFSRYRWREYSEHLMMSLLALGSPTQPLPEKFWHDWKRERPLTYGGSHFLAAGPLFIHQFSQAFFDFRDRRDAFADYHRNSELATLAQRQFCIDLAPTFPSWGEKMWGVTASDSARGYLAWGGPPRGHDGGALDGTLVPCAAAGSLPFAPRETVITLRHMREAHGDRIWRRYGFVDAFNLETGWVAPDVIGLDVGITLVQAENVRTGLIWKLFNQAPEIRRSLNRAGFVSTQRGLPPAVTARLRSLAESAWHSLATAAVSPETAGLRLGALVSAQALGLVSTDAVTTAAQAILTTTRAPTNDVALALFAAGLVTLRQAVPALAPEATTHLDAIGWSEVALSSRELGSASRLAAFFQVATRVRSADAWTNLARTPLAHGPVHVLAPAATADQALPGLWLDEREIITGASASQLAYAGRTEALDPLSFALLLEHFPAEASARLADGALTEEAIARASERDRAAFVVTTANALAGDALRRWFQADPLVRAGRAAIPEFAEAAFGARSSIVARRELAGPTVVPRPRQAAVRSANRPPAEWDWQTLVGSEFKDFTTDVRAGDPAISLRFALAWDEAALVFRAEAMDTPAGYLAPEKRREVVELFLDPRGNGFSGERSKDLLLSFISTGTARDVLHKLPFPAEIMRGPHGFTLHARIPWSKLGVQPAAGLRIGATAAVQVTGPHSHHPAQRLNWRRHTREDGANDLGTLVLEP